MTIATIGATVTNSTTPLTVPSVLNSIKAAMTLATNTTQQAGGYTVTTTLFDDRSASGGAIIYEVITDSTKTKGRAYLRITAAITATTTLTISQSLSDTWNPTTGAVVTGQAPAGVASSFSLTFNTNNVINFTPIRHPEMQLVLIDQGTTPFAYVGWLRPFHKPVEWDEVSCPYLFVPSNELLITYAPVSFNIVPFTGGTGVNLAPHPQYQKVNKISGLPPIKTGPLELLVVTANEGGCGSFSSDIAIGGCSTIPRIINTVTTSTGTYTILASNAAGASLLIQTA